MGLRLCNQRQPCVLIEAPRQVRGFVGVAKPTLLVAERVNTLLRGQFTSQEVHGGSAAWGKPLQGIIQTRSLGARAFQQ